MIGTSGGGDGSKAPKKRSSGRWKKGSGGIVSIAEGVWRVDVEAARGAITGRRRCVSRRVTRTRRDAEVVAAKLRVANHEQ